MSKTKRIELLEQRVAELIGEVEKLKWERFEEGLMIEHRRTPPYVPMWNPTNNKSYGNTSHG